MRNEARIAAWRAYAEKAHGFVFDEASVQLRGTMEGFVLSMSEASLVKASASIEFAPPLDLFWQDRTDVRYFNGSWWPSPPRAEALLDDHARSVLDHLSELGGVVLNAAELSIGVSHDLADAGIISRLLSALVEVGSCIEARRELVPVDPAVAPFEGGVVAIASELGLRVMRSPLGFAGANGGISIYAWMWPDRPNELTIAIRPERAPKLDLRMRSRDPSFLERLGVVREGDPELGDAELDRALTITTNDIEAARARLGPAERDGLRTIIGGAHLELERGEVRLQGVALARAATLIAAGRQVVKALAGIASVAGPFR